MNDVVLGAAVAGFFGIITALINRSGQKKLLEKTAEVHVLVNDRSTRQEDKITGLQKEVSILRDFIAGEREKKAP